MRALVISIFAALTMFGCAHGLQTAGDLRIGETYEVKMENQAKGCLFTVRNVITSVPTEAGIAVPAKFLGFEAMLCGELDCSKTPVGQKTDFQCLPFESLK